MDVDFFAKNGRLGSERRRGAHHQGETMALISFEGELFLILSPNSTHHDFIRPATGISFKEFMNVFNFNAHQAHRYSVLIWSARDFTSLSQANAS